MTPRLRPYLLVAGTLVPLLGMALAWQIAERARH
jgi:hypothetical protein